ncbi:MAG: S24 family peptidase [Terriglobales bacterium]
MRSETRCNSRLFGELVRSLLKDGITVRFRAQGRSMYPAIADGDTVQVNPTAAPEVGDVVMAETTHGLRVHRIVKSGDTISTRGDCCFEADDDPRPLGRVVVVEGRTIRAVSRRSAGTVVRRWLAGWRGRF